MAIFEYPGPYNLDKNILDVVAADKRAYDIQGLCKMMESFHNTNNTTKELECADALNALMQTILTEHKKS